MSVELDLDQIEGFDVSASTLLQTDWNEADVHQVQCSPGEVFSTTRALNLNRRLFEPIESREGLDDAIRGAVTTGRAPGV